MKCEIENRRALASFINEIIVEKKEWLVVPCVKGKATREQDKETIKSREKGDTASLSSSGSMVICSYRAIE